MVIEKVAWGGGQDSNVQRDSVQTFHVHYLNTGLWFGHEGLGMYIVLVPGQNFSYMDIRKYTQ